MPGTLARASSSGELFPPPDQDGLATSPLFTTPGQTKVARASSSGELFPPPDQDGRTNYSDSFTPANFDSLRIYTGENLPHWQCENAIYHVSFRLADSVPETKRHEWLAERKTIESRAIQANRLLTEEEEKRIQFLYSERIERFLDTGYGACHLRKPSIGDLVATALCYFDGKRYSLHAWCVMPNHVHVIVEPAKEFELPVIIHSWKSFTAQKANKLLNRTGSFWHEDAYNHIIRTEKEYQFQLDYVYKNPEKAGLKNWKWVARISSSSYPEKQ